MKFVTATITTLLSVGFLVVSPTSMADEKAKAALNKKIDECRSALGVSSSDGASLALNDFDDELNKEFEKKKNSRQFYVVDWWMISDRARTAVEKHFSYKKKYDSACAGITDDIKKAVK